ncbi:MSHA biogenesis protein MshK [Vibrio sp. HDW18]|uniref:MSHA biogenesis protein MshK n=1 Tax=Vibrio sp. HDW18 TaxID=2714948 RepID=UPI0014095AD7|nr:MSHA biogenesis protein MshK [Vibrio sp. HDW18]QIL86504.1 MSHA biogenesis protein MshK [Vibrio sp. HDW18]
MLLGLSVMAVCSYANQDPTAPLDWHAPSKSSVTAPRQRVPSLQSIVCAEGRSCYAIIEQKIVAQGDVVNGYRVAAIQSQQVQLTRAGKAWQLELFALDIK